MLKRIGPLLRCATSVLDVRLDFDRFPSTNRRIRGCEENGEEIKFNENLFSRNLLPGFFKTLSEQSTDDYAKFR